MPGRGHTHGACPQCVVTTDTAVATSSRQGGSGKRPCRSDGANVTLVSLASTVRALSILSASEKLSVVPLLQDEALVKSQTRSSGPREPHRSPPWEGLRGAAALAPCLGLCAHVCLSSGDSVLVCVCVCLVLTCLSLCSLIFVLSLCGSWESPPQPASPRHCMLSRVGDRIVH